MSTIWLSYAWGDNESGDVDYVAQELGSSGIIVKLDRWNIQAGKRLWEQIADFIQKPSECDAWVLYATSNSLGSEPCKEEFTYALDRALNARGQHFPIIGLFPASVDSDLIPAGIKSRLFVSLTDPDWKERIKAASEGSILSVGRPQIAPYFIQVHASGAKDRPHSIEVRPRAGTWSPFFAAIPISEKDSVKPSILHGPKGRLPAGGVLFNCGDALSDDGQWWIMFAQNEATPTQSYYINCQNLPSKMAFGINGDIPQYIVNF